jgi:putative RNA 2'-phosphotransferase
MDFSKLSKEVSYALRHAPWEYEIELDNEGWVSVEQLLMALRFDKRWKLVP